MKFSYRKISYLVISFAAGIVLTTPGGNYWLDIVDTSLGIQLLLVALFQLIVVGWFFGAKKWMNEIRWMIGPPSNIFDTFYRYFLMASWLVTGPVLILGILIYYITDVVGNPPTYRRWSAQIGGFLSNDDGSENFVYDALGTTITVLLHMAIFCPLPIFAVAAFYRKGKWFSWSNIKDDDTAIIYRK